MYYVCTMYIYTTGILAIFCLCHHLLKNVDETFYENNIISANIFKLNIRYLTSISNRVLNRIFFHAKCTFFQTSIILDNIYCLGYLQKFLV